MTEIGQAGDKMLEWADENRSPCPKCGFPDQEMSNGLVTYRPSWDECHCSRGLVDGEHLELCCFRCQYLRPMKTKDWVD
jgi:hypothetical protein